MKKIDIAFRIALIAALVWIAFELRGVNFSIKDAEKDIYHVSQNLSEIKIEIGSH